MGLGIFSPQNFLNTKNDYQLQKKKKIVLVVLSFTC